MTRTAPDVDLVELIHRETGGKRLLVRGLSTCNSVHSCPCCAEKILTARAQELSEAVKLHGHPRTALGTFTLKHRPTHDLYIQRRIETDAFSRMFAGKGGQRFKKRIGLVGTMRGAEQTHGDKGWHPHIHALLLLTAPPKDVDEKGIAQRLRMQCNARWRNAVAATWRYFKSMTLRGLACGLGTEHLTAEYKRRVDGQWVYETRDDPKCNCAECGPRLYSQARKTFGARYFAWRTVKKNGATCEEIREAARRFAGDFGSMPKLRDVLPDLVHGVDVRMGASAKYIAKLGLEVSSVTKTNKNKEEGEGKEHAGRNPWTIARDAIAGDKRSQGLWREHSRAMFGARQITWSRGLRKLLALPEVSDRDLAREDGACLVGAPHHEQPIGLIVGATWDDSAKVVGQLTFASLFQAYDEGRIWSHELVTPLYRPRRLKVPARQVIMSDPADRVVNVRISDEDRAARRTLERDGPVRLWWEDWVPVRTASLRGVPKGSTVTHPEPEVLEAARARLLGEGLDRKAMLEELDRVRRRETTIRRATVKNWSGGTVEERREQLEELRHHIRFDLCGQ